MKSERVCSALVFNIHHIMMPVGGAILCASILVEFKKAICFCFYRETKFFSKIKSPRNSDTQHALFKPTKPKIDSIISYHFGSLTSAVVGAPQMT